MKGVLQARWAVTGLLFKFLDIGALFADDDAADLVGHKHAHGIQTARLYRVIRCQGHLPYSPQQPSDSRMA